MSRTLLASVLGVAFALSSMPDVASAADAFPRDYLQGIKSMQQLPAEGFHVVESNDGRFMLVSTNGHYVILNPKILDMWNQVEVKSVSDLKASDRIPLSRMGLSADKLGGVTLGDKSQAKRTTVFLDPASPESSKVLPAVRELASKQRVDVVFFPAAENRTDTTRALVCDPAAAMRFVERGQLPAPRSASDGCGNEAMQRTRVTIQLLGIEVLPFTVAPNGATVIGTPKDYVALVNKNLE